VARLYIRQARVTALNFKTGIAKIFDSITTKKKDASGNEREVGGVRIKFKIGKTSESSPNKATIEIYNLSPESRNFFDKGELKIVLEAGYRDLISTIFIGDISNSSESTSVVHVSNPPDTITTLNCGEGQVAMDTAHTDKGFLAGTPVQSVITELTSDISIFFPGAIKPNSSNIPPITSAFLPFGLTISGSPKIALDNLSKTYNFDWSIQNGAIVVTKDREPTKDTAVIVTSKTGLLGRVERKEGGSILFKSLLNPRIIPAAAVRLGTPPEVSWYKVQTVNFEGDTHGEAWVSEVEAEHISTSISLNTLFTNTVLTTA